MRFVITRAGSVALETTSPRRALTRAREIAAEHGRACVTSLDESTGREVQRRMVCR